jgi:hypothetical protein
MPGSGLGDAARSKASGSSLAALAVVALPDATTVLLASEEDVARKCRERRLSSVAFGSYRRRVEHLPPWPPFPPYGGQVMSPARAGVRRLRDSE